MTSQNASSPLETLNEPDPCRAEATIVMKKELKCFERFMKNELKCFVRFSKPRIYAVRQHAKES